MAAIAAGTSAENQLRTEVEQIWNESDSHRKSIMEWEMQVPALTVTLHSLGVEHHDLASRGQDPQITATVCTL